jgi:hypothetical protein
MNQQQQSEPSNPLSLSDLSPEFKAGVFISVIKPYSLLGEQAVIEDVKHQIGLVLAGDLTRPEAMLAGQAEALDALFYSLLSQAHRSKDPHELAALVGAAVEAQAGCRSAVEGLATFKRLTSVSQ